MAKVYELPIEQLPFSLGYDYPIRHIPPVHQDADSKNWSIRIEVGRSYHGDTTTLNWDYFRCDPDGLVMSSPRGYAKQYNKKCRITGLAEWKS